MKNKFFTVVFGTVLIMAMSSCSKAPEQEMAAATAAVDSAKSVQADLFLPAEFNGLQDSLRVATEAMETAKSKFFLTRNYDESKAKFVNVTTLANGLVEKTAVRKTEIHDEVLATLAEVKALLEENMTLMNEAPKGKEGKEALEEMKSELTVVESSITEVSSLLDKGDLIAANDKITVARDKANGINTELKDAIAKYKGKNKKA